MIDNHEIVDLLESILSDQLDSYTEYEVTKVSKSGSTVIVEMNDAQAQYDEWREGGSLPLQIPNATWLHVKITVEVDAAIEPLEVE